jgi:integrase
LAAGRHRDPNAPAVSDEEAVARAAEDRQDAELVRIAAYAGLRRGELVALRWRDVNFRLRKLVVSRAVSADIESSSTKSRRAREVPLPDQAAGALDRLSQRRDFTRPETMSSPAGLAAASTAPPSVVASIEPARLLACAHSDSTTCATPTARYSSRAASTSPP